MFLLLALIRSDRNSRSIKSEECDNKRRILANGKLNLNNCDFKVMKFDDECPKNEHTKLHNDAKLVNCTFIDIKVISENGIVGGAIDILETELNLVRCQYSDSGQGGGVYCAGSYNYFHNCTFNSCSADLSGGAFYCVDCKGSTNANCTIFNCTNNGFMKGLNPIIEFIKVIFDHCFHTSDEVSKFKDPCMLNLASIANLLIQMISRYFLNLILYCQIHNIRL